MVAKASFLLLALVSCSSASPIPDCFRKQHPHQNAASAKSRFSTFESLRIILPDNLVPAISKAESQNPLIILLEESDDPVVDQALVKEVAVHVPHRMESTVSISLESSRESQEQEEALPYLSEKAEEGHIARNVFLVVAVALLALCALDLLRLAFVWCRERVCGREGAIKLSACKESETDSPWTVAHPVWDERDFSHTMKPTVTDL